MTTKAGERLISEEWDNFDAKPWGSIAAHVDAIEAEARAAVLAELRAKVEGLPAYPDTFGLTLERAVVLALLEPKS